MKRFFSIIVICLLSFNLFSVDLSKVKIGDSKAQVIKQYGTPFKEIKNGKFEYDVWVDKKDIWMVSLENDKVATDPCMVEDLLKTLLDISNAFSDLSFDTSSASSTTTSNSSIVKTTPAEKIDKSLLKSIDITILECCIINKDYNPKAGYRLKVKNNGSKEITKLKIVLYFYDKKGNVFFEDDCTLIDSDSYSGQKNLKPNYSVLIPENTSTFYTAQGMDLDEWAEGKVTFEIVELQ